SEEGILGQRGNLHLGHLHIEQAQQVLHQVMGEGTRGNLVVKSDGDGLRLVGSYENGKYAVVSVRLEEYDESEIAYGYVVDPGLQEILVVQLVCLLWFLIHYPFLPMPFPVKITDSDQTLKRKCMISPSLTMYSLPS